MSHYIYKVVSGARRCAALVSLLVILPPLGAAAQMLDPVKFTVDVKRVSDTEIDVTFNGKIDGGWHVYSPNVPDDGPTQSTLKRRKTLRNSAHCKQEAAR